jgi:hypothetical protein
MHMPSEYVRPRRTRNPLRRLSTELILIVLGKIAFLSLIGWYVSAHYPRADTRPAAVERLLAPSSPNPPESKP